MKHMGECLIVRRGGEAYELPALNENYPADAAVTAGTDVTAGFFVQIETPGRPAEYTYQWYKNGAAVSGANGSNYTATGLTAAGTYSVYCEVTNKAGTVQSRAATLTVRSLPVLNASYPANVSVIESASASATFVVNIATAGSPASYTYQWYKNGAAVSGATGTSYTVTGLTAAGTHTVYCKVTSAAGSVQSRTATLTVVSSQPAFTYTGTYRLAKENTYDWKLTLLTSGTLTFTSLGNGAGNIDYFLAGGGAGGGKGAGGGGGYTRTSTAVVKANTAYAIVIGAGGAANTNGGATSAFGASVNGGTQEPNEGGAGGSGGGGPSWTGVAGNGGSNGGNGSDVSKSGDDAARVGGKGQGTTTREFGASNGTLYCGGGGGGTQSGTRGSGGSGGGGNGATGSVAPGNGQVNTGGGGGGCNQNITTGIGSGGSGIVVIRNKR